MSDNPYLDVLPTQLNQEAIEFLLSYGKRETWQAGEVLVEEGEPCNRVFIILDGTASIIKQDQAGHSNLIAEVGNGSVIGEMGVFLDLQRSASIVADSELTALELSNDKFVAALQNFASIPIRLLRSFSHKMVGVNEKLVNQRHAFNLLYLCLRILENFDHRETASDELQFDLQQMSELSGVLVIDLTNALLDLEVLGLIVDVELKPSREVTFRVVMPQLRDYVHSAQMLI